MRRPAEEANVMSERNDNDPAANGVPEMGDRNEDGKGRGVLRTLSHEIRTPLNNIIGFADMMSAEMLGPMSHPQYREYAEDIRKSGQSILDLLNDLLESRRYEGLMGDDEHHASLIDLAPDLIVVCRTDGTIESLNPAGCAMLGLDPDTVSGSSLLDYVHSDYKSEFGDNFSELLGEQRRATMKFLAEDGREVDVEVAAVSYENDNNENAAQCMLVARDVTEKNLALRDVTER